ncbi:hypothetical protein DLM78_00295 [Leptospira stimsonii]|uniref:Uncharacterized protein n=1 Tax=Leptospira stimsonii TaxID=2202203 RepID=A0A8B6RYX6_9LEPT|nr:hypothetical protein DLM78_00295 [Leptospira stimsonii]
MLTEETFPSKRIERRNFGISLTFWDLKLRSIEDKEIVSIEAGNLRAEKRRCFRSSQKLELD